MGACILLPLCKPIANPLEHCPFFIFLILHLFFQNISHDELQVAVRSMAYVFVQYWLLSWGPACKQKNKRTAKIFHYFLFFLSWVWEEFFFNHNIAMANPDRRFIFSSALVSDTALFCTLKHIQNIHSSLRNTFLVLKHFQNVPFSITPSLSTHFL